MVSFMLSQSLLNSKLTVMDVTFVVPVSKKLNCFWVTMYSIQVAWIQAVRES